MKKGTSSQASGSAASGSVVKSAEEEGFLRELRDHARVWHIVYDAQAGILYFTNHADFIASLSDKRKFLDAYQAVVAKVDQVRQADSTALAFLHDVLPSADAVDALRGMSVSDVGAPASAAAVAGGPVLRSIRTNESPEGPHLYCLPFCSMSREEVDTHILQMEERSRFFFVACILGWARERCDFLRSSGQATLPAGAISESASEGQSDPNQPARDLYKKMKSSIENLEWLFTLDEDGQNVTAWITNRQTSSRWLDQTAFERRCARFAGKLDAPFQPITSQNDRMDVWVVLGDQHTLLLRPMGVIAHDLYKKDVLPVWSRHAKEFWADKRFQYGNRVDATRYIPGGKFRRPLDAFCAYELGVVVKNERPQTFNHLSVLVSPRPPRAGGSDDLGLLVDEQHRRSPTASKACGC